MFPKVNPTTTKSWKNLTEIRKSYGKTFPLKETLEATDWNQRLAQLELQDCTFDFSKNYLNEKIFQELLELAEECGLNAAMNALKAGQRINETENRAVLHTALRSIDGYDFDIDNKNIRKEVDTQLARIKVLCDQIHDKVLKGVTGETIKTVVNIGIGGSDLGPCFVNEALKDYHQGVQTYFLNNIDGNNLADILEQINPLTTLFVVVSKTFTTIETMTNAASVRNWFTENGYNEKQVFNHHFIAVSTECSIDKVTEFGIPKEKAFLFWNWVGGRFSLWSAAGISIPLTIGFDNFKQLLKGAQEADEHFFQKPFHENIPVLDALLTIWYTNFWGCSTHAILPYSKRLKKLSNYLQQAVMESNGKSVDRNNNQINYSTSPIIFGGQGTNSQHSFFQLLHQGTWLIPTQFIKVNNVPHKYKNHQVILNANCLAQADALLEGQTHCSAQQYYEGNKPSTLITMDELTPKNLGMLLAFYEHRIFSEGILWNIYSFDQWGVELGKKIAKERMNNSKI
jgi:glucose-6-phosphate isomerase